MRLFALTKIVSTGRMPYSFAKRSIQFFKRLRFTDFGYKSTLFATNNTGLSPIKRFNPEIILPYKSNKSTT